MSPELTRLLKHCRKVIREERDALVEGHCRKDRDGKPDLTTIDDAAKRPVAQMDRLLARLDAAISSPRT